MFIISNPSIKKETKKRIYFEYVITDDHNKKNKKITLKTRRLFNVMLIK